MRRKDISDEELKRCADLYREHGGFRSGARAAGLNRDTFRNRVQLAAERGFMPTKPVMPGFAIKQTTAKLDASGKVEGEWIKQTKAPGGEFVMPDGHEMSGVSAFTDGAGRVLFQWSKTRNKPSATPALVAALKSVFASYRGRAKPAPRPRCIERDLLTVYQIADQHNGLLAWGRETGEAYDLKIGIARLRDCMARLVAQSRPSREAIILNLGDWQHTDDQRNMTPRSGNLLDVDSRYRKILEAGVWLMIDCIDLALQRHDRVRVRNIPGNHDPHASVALTIALAMFYRRDKRVIIDDDPSDFFFHRFGQTLIGANHGHKMKPDKMAMMMATARRKDWGETKYHVFYHGHIHHETAKEIGDCRVESFRTIAAKDAHAVSSGYMSGQSLVAITHHRRDGEIGRHRVNLPPVQV